MEVVLIDQFRVPEAAIAEFLQQVRFSAERVRSQPGFVAGFVHQRVAGEGPVNVVTTAVWADQAALDAAKQSIAAEFARIGFNPPQIMQRLGIQMERGIYRRSAY